LAIIKPFKALRPSAEKAEQVACVPYDVVSKDQLRSFVDENPLSFLRVTRPRYEFEKGQRPSWGQIFDKARSNLGWFQQEKILALDEQDAVYIYRLSNGNHSQTGIVACCSIDEYESGVIKKHENVKPDKVDERAGHIVTLKAQTGLIFLAFRGTQNISDLIAKTTAGEAIYDFEGVDEIQHTVWRVEGGEEFVSAFRDVPSIYIADGHHRIEAARLARNELRAQNPSHTGNEDYNYVMAGMFPAEELRILPYNRVVRNLVDLSEMEFIERLKASYREVGTDERVPTRHGDICVYVGYRWRCFRFNAEAEKNFDPIERLDVSILQAYVLAPILGIDDPRTNERIVFVGGKRSVDEIERLVNTGEAAVGFSLYPPTIDDMLTVSDMGETMPPKSTWFEPKLKDGLLVHLI
jgi:uncharacterized protein (DUF1015 family)